VPISQTPSPVEAAEAAPSPGQLSRQLKLRLALNVAHARNRAGLTQFQLAQAAELSRATVHLIEAGACDPRLSTISHLAEALGVDTVRLLTDERRLPPPSR
jgi:DNA-binding XRE family transcriptional regulator